MLGRSTLVHTSRDLRVWDVRCVAPAGHRAVEGSTSFEVVLPLSGVFRRRAQSEQAIVDAGGGYVSAPGTEHLVTHVSGGDRCFALVPDTVLADELGLDAWGASRPWMVRSSARMHRGLITAWLLNGDADGLRREEAWLAVLSETLRLPVSSTPRNHDVQLQRRAVDSVREAVAADPGGPWTMRGLSAIAGYSPHHLSRIFHRHAAMTVTEFRDRIRLGAAAAQLADGQSAARVAAILGFVDHSHLTRRFRQVLGVVPSQLRHTPR